MQRWQRGAEDKKGDARALHGVAIASILQRKFPDALGKMKEARRASLFRRSRHNVAVLCNGDET